MSHATQKVAVFLSSYRAGGGEKQLIDIANALAAQGHKVDLLVLKPVGPYKSLLSPALGVVSLDGRRMILSLPPLAAYMRRERPRVLLATDEYTSLLALMARALVRGRTRIVLRMGNMFSELFARYEGKSKLMPFLIRRLYKKADAMIANSQGVARSVMAVCGIPAERMHVIFNPKDIAKITALAAEPAPHPWLAVEHIKPAVVWFGRLREQKNLPLLLRAFAALQSKVESRLLIVGSGREEGRLHALATQLGIQERVHFEEYKENPYAWVAKADVFVLSSLWEGLPNALIEALVCGVACVATDCDSGPREILAPDTDPFKRIKSGVEWARFGALVPVEGTAELTEALETLLTYGPKRAQYAKAALERAHDFDSAGIIDRYAQVLGV
jgi:glycosyltransferase involved in cell wall biosynthesis